jgi:hypothetical protein
MREGYDTFILKSAGSVGDLDWVEVATGIFLCEKNFDRERLRVATQDQNSRPKRPKNIFFLK